MEKRPDVIPGNGPGALFQVTSRNVSRISNLSQSRKAESIRAFHGFLQISGVVIFAAHDSNLLPGNPACSCPGSGDNNGHVKKPFPLLNMH